MLAKEQGRFRRHRRLRKRVIGTPERLRLSVRRSLKHIYAQVIDDLSAATVVSASTLDAGSKETRARGGTLGAAKAVGQRLAERAKAKGITSVVFDRGGYQYHGRVRAVAEGAREGGLNF
jgi:large subunit ribosomal protein L18